MGYKKLKGKLNKAVKLREEGHLDKSRKVFEELMGEIESLLEKDSSKELKKLYAECWGGYVIQYRLEGKRSHFEALELGKKLLEYDKKHKLNHPLSVRSISNTLIDMRLYEQAVPYLKKLIKLYKGDIALVGDTKVHLAYCLFRMGKFEEAENLVEEGSGKIKLGSKTGKNNTHYIAGLMLKAMIINTNGDSKRAKNMAKEAYQISKQEKIATRISQTKILLDSLKGN